jgi:hypothetical protein
MTQHYQSDGVSFDFPDDWLLDREESADGWTVMLQSRGTAFLTLTCDQSGATTEEIAAAALDALKAEYPTLEVQPKVDTLAGQMAVGHDIQFFSLDLTNTCWTRSIYSSDGVMLLLCQCNDLELEQYEPVLRAVCASLTVEEE